MRGLVCSMVTVGLAFLACGGPSETGDDCCESGGGGYSVLESPSVAVRFNLGGQIAEPEVLPLQMELTVEASALEPPRPADAVVVPGDSDGAAFHVLAADLAASVEYTAGALATYGELRKFGFWVNQGSVALGTRGDVLIPALSGRLAAWRGASGLWAAPERFELLSGAFAFTLADVDGDAVVDIVAVGRSTEDSNGDILVRCALGIGAGPPALSDPLAVLQGDGQSVVKGVAAGDLDEDGSVDLALVLSHSGGDPAAELVVARGDGACGFHPTDAHALEYGVVDIAIAELDGASGIDVIVGPPVQRFAGNGSGTLADPVMIPDAAELRIATTGSLLGDPAIDDVIGLTPALVVLVDGAAGPAYDLGSLEESSPTFVDVDRDGLLDLVTVVPGELTEHH
jgi:hypothetical protein